MGLVIKNRHIMRMVMGQIIVFVQCQYISVRNGNGAELAHMHDAVVARCVLQG